MFRQTETQIRSEVVHSMAKKLSVKTSGTIDGNLNVRTDGLRPSVQRLKNITNKHKTEKHTENLGVYIWRWNFHQIYLTLNLWQKRIKRDRWHNSRANRYINITFSQYAMQCNAMQCNAMQYNAMQCNEMQYSNAIQLQCNAMQSDNMYGSPSVRTEWSQSSHFFLLFFFFLVSMRSPSVCTEHNVTDGQTSFSFFLSVCTMSRMDRQVSVISVQFQSHTVKKSVRPYGGPNKKKKKKMLLNKHRNTDPIGGNTFKLEICSWNLFALEFIKRDRWHNSKHAAINITFSQYAIQCNAIQCNTMSAMQYSNAMQCNTMQCMYGSPSVRTEWSQSVIFFYFFWPFVSTYGVPSVCTRNTNVTDGQTSFSYFSCQYVECNGWTDKFQLFQFSFSSVAYSQVSLSQIHTERSKKKKNVVDNRQTQIRSEVIHSGQN
jgi:hypothetical protein